MAEALLYQETESGLYIKAEGHVTAAVSTDLKDLVLSRLALAPAPPRLAADLSACDYMDSTFMGLLVGFHKRFRQITGRALTVLRPTQECLKLLTGLGILRLMDLVVGDEPASPSTWTSLHPRHAPRPEVLWGAHRDLSELSPENEKKFSALEDILKQQIEKKDL